MNNPYTLSPQRARERALFLYASALQNGDFDRVSAVLKLAERDPILDRMIKDFDSLDSAPEARPESPARALQNGKGIHQVITIHPASPHGQPPSLDHDEEEAKMTTLNVPIRTENPKTLSPFAMRFITLAAAILMIALVGGVLIEMANGHPKTGYPGSAGVLTETPTCEASTDYMAQGASSITTGDYTAALTAYNCAITRDADNNAAHLLRGALAGAAGDYDQFGLDLYTYNSHNPADVNNLLNVPVADILPTLASAIEARPDDAPLYLLRGIVLDRTTLSGKSDLVRFKELAPDNAIGYLYSWRAFNDLNDENLQKAIQIAPHSVLLDLILWGNLTEENAALLRPYLDQAIQANPQHPFAYNARGYMDVVMGDSAAAAQDFYQHIQLNASDVTELDGLTLGEKLTAEVSVDHVYRLPFTAQAGQTLDITAARISLSGGGPTVVVLDPAGNVMPVTYTIGANIAVPPPIVNLEIPESGTYSLLVKTNSVVPMTINVGVQGITYHSSTFELPLTVTYPRGWYVLEEYSDVVTFMGLQRPSVDLAFMTLKNTTIASPEAPYSAVPFPDDFINWIQSHSLFQVDEVQPTVVGGAQGTQIDVTSTAECGTRKNWIFLSRTGWNCSEGQHIRFIYLPDVDGQPVLILMTSGELVSEGLGTGQETAQAIIDSAAFTR